MIMVRTIKGDRIPIKGATEKDFKFVADSKIVLIKDYVINLDQIIYLRFIDEEEA